MKLLLATLGLGAEAQEPEAVALVADLQASNKALLELTQSPTVPEAMGVVKAGLQALETVKALAADLEGYKTREVASKKQAILSANERKFNEGLRTWALSQPLEALEAFIKIAPDLVPVVLPLSQPGVESGATIVVSDEEIRIGRAMGHTKEQIIEHKALVAKKGAV
jgi:hypothetical protein